MPWAEDDKGLAGVPFEGHVDGLAGDRLNGWVVRADTREGGLRVGLYAGDRLLATTVADLYRADVEKAGMGDGKAGFAFAITERMRQTLGKRGETLEVRPVGTEALIGRCEFPGEDAIALSLTEAQADRLRAELADPLLLLESLLSEIDGGGASLERPPLAPHARLLSTRRAAPGEGSGESTKLPAYLDFAKFRLRVDTQYDTEGTPADLDHFLNWYLVGYGPTRTGLRTPLTKDLIDHLNAPLVMGGQSFALTRFMWWRLVQHHGLLQSLNLSDPAWFGHVAYWWAGEEAPGLGVEDCLVPQHIADAMRLVDPQHREKRMPLSRFMEYRFNATQDDHFLDMSRVADRTAYTLCALVRAVEEPHILRYIPHRSLATLLAPRDGAPSLLQEFCVTLGMPEPEAPLDADRYAAALRLQGYDLPSHSFLTRTEAGHRLHAAALPRPKGEPVDVQVIGPFAKASGLGQATRLSARILEHTGLSLNRVDFGLDNPAPEGFSSASAVADYRPARVNLIHLNAESIPLVYAYGPDVFSGAYNIGYFFWELDSPALCHYLALDLLDEIWVSTEYGVSIYQPETEKPVRNVRMCYEELGEIDRAAARRFIDRRFRFRADEFVFLVTFDSFSFVQRKNPVGVLEAFRRAFPDDPDVRLIVKTQNRENVFDSAQARIWKRVDAILAEDPRILLMNETLPYDQLLELKAGSDAYVSLHRSEGWGFGMIEAMNLKVPVLCTGYSGNMEFCSDETAWLVDYEEVTLAPDDYIFVRPGQKWAEPDIADAAAKLRALRDDPAARERKAEAAFRNVRENFSAEAVAQRYGARLREILGSD